MINKLTVLFLKGILAIFVLAAAYSAVAPLATGGTISIGDAMFAVGMGLILICIDPL